MKSCVIFACTIISEHRLIVLHDFLESFKQNFLESDFYIGINPISLPQVENIINESGLNVISINRCSELLYSQSDASAYQIALKSLYESKNSYENYWFIHTKSGVNEHSNYLRDWYIHNFLGNKNSIESFIINTPDIGSYGMLGLEYDESKNYSETDCEIDIFKNTLTVDLPNTHANFFYIHTMYVINKKPMDVFFKLVTNIWFETKLDRYYFEGVFPFIVSRSGYFPYLENQFSCTRVDLQPYINQWIMTNNLEKYKNYTNIFKTTFTFHQLNPPYVNSNT
ncbi:hypothetical protein UFOVP1307_161 [uncultured Caudovirales phage]|uniref:Uncharacterized protein n=1 Tax=uncultured Caudovirales phage TaxID=2100421 RepID=A0A6J5N6T9_9CAUD|nr:hypothetical protein UFOVP651_185 [uncultured Caudovirales phage]CAB4170513.1 hypothetical protein UFOVP902_41 [uncultured Caudovirales phage]CAB4198581.1 hypothetical protein UFOVP1307_161 [uncultured Caudovirales phage]